MNRVLSLTGAFVAKPALCVALIIAVARAGQAEEATFSKIKYSSVKQPKEADVILSITDSKISIKGKGKNRSGIDMEIPYSSIESMSYELASRHRLAEGAAVMALSLGAGAILMATKTKSHWLDIQYDESDAKQLTVLQLDKSEYKAVIAALEAKTGKHVAILDSKNSPLNPVVGSKDMDQMVPFGREKVAAALKFAMENEGCKVTEEKEDRMECKRARGGSERSGFGGEKVTVTLEANADQTRVRIQTGKGVVGRLGKKNWSTAIYEEMMKNLQERAPSA